MGNTDNPGFNSMFNTVCEIVRSQCGVLNTLTFDRFRIVNAPNRVKVIVSPDVIYIYAHNGGTKQYVLRDLFRAALEVTGSDVTVSICKTPVDNRFNGPYISPSEAALRAKWAHCYIPY